MPLCSQCSKEFTPRAWTQKVCGDEICLKKADAERERKARAMPYEKRLPIDSWDYFYSLTRKLEAPKKRKCLRCKKSIVGTSRMCGPCVAWISRQSSHAGDVVV